MPAEPRNSNRLQLVRDEILRLDPDGSRIAQVLRNTFDQLYNGQLTGRYRWDQLYKTEKTHCGTLIEINLHREFEFLNGDDMDYKIAGIEVDCKYSQRLNGWMIPPEALNHVCMLLWAEYTASPIWNLGLVQIKTEHLNSGSNRDAKFTLNEAGRNSIDWLFQGKEFPPNVLLQLDEKVVEKILNQGSGQRNVNELFRNTLGLRVGRAVVATAAQQDDPMKRVRYNGGARSALQKEGIIILGQYNNHGDIAKKLGVPVPQKGESVAVKLTKAAMNDPGAVKLAGGYYRIATKNDKFCTAPVIECA